jgi:hypothetical protein
MAICVYKIHVVGAWITISVVGLSDTEIKQVEKSKICCCKRYDVVDRQESMYSFEVCLQYVFCNTVTMYGS